MSKITPDIYVKPGCPWCAEALEFLDRHSIPYKKIDVIADQKAFVEMIRISGQAKAPTMKWGDDVLADFGAAELEPFLRERGVIK
ncbi:glutaredoxin family protein [Oscillatoria laete-virens NRMC-F 0139]|nr:glutaredoxin family protein [Oscillatoria laete-virens]MDL5052996.1 glutaredoxin family protein [Oscillatoria laete-virens NRMC-F 0139]